MSSSLTHLIFYHLLDGLPDVHLHLLSGDRLVVKCSHKGTRVFRHRANSLGPSKVEQAGSGGLVGEDKSMMKTIVGQLDCHLIHTHTEHRNQATD